MMKLSRDHLQLLAKQVFGWLAILYALKFIFAFLFSLENPWEGFHLFFHGNSEGFIFFVVWPCEIPCYYVFLRLLYKRADILIPRNSEWNVLKCAFWFVISMLATLFLLQSFESALIHSPSAPRIPTPLLLFILDLLTAALAGIASAITLFRPGALRKAHG